MLIIAFFDNIKRTDTSIYIAKAKNQFNLVPLKLLTNGKNQPPSTEATASSQSFTARAAAFAPIVSGGLK